MSNSIANETLFDKWIHIPKFVCKIFTLMWFKFDKIDQVNDVVNDLKKQVDDLKKQVDGLKKKVGQINNRNRKRKSRAVASVQRANAAKKKACTSLRATWSDEEFADWCHDNAHEELWNDCSALS